MLLLSQKGIARLGRALKTVKKWRKRGVATPLFITRAYIETSLDTFPIELLNFQAAYKVLRGEDPLGCLVFNHKMLRLQCERELKGKLLQLREQFLDTAGSAHLIKELITRSLPTFFAIFQGIIYLHGKTQQPTRRTLLNAMQHVVSLDEALFDELHNVREGRTQLKSTDAIALMERYIEEVRRLALAVDRLEEPGE
jgi:hypothetical protein